jgi:hypothetical protein
VPGRELNLALVFPEVYEIGMSHQGLKILYDALAPRSEDVNAERMFMPWNDLLRASWRPKGLPHGPWRTAWA